MIFAYLDLLEISFKAFLAFFGAVVVALVVGISFHEFSHALIATGLGDSTPRRQGRLSLNPLRHLDTAGTVLLFLGGFGWGKPVPVNPNALRDGARSGMALVALAGPLSNLATAALFSVPIKLGWLPWRSPFVIRSLVGLDDYMGLFISSIVIFSIVLAVFNLIPLAPLDGFRVVAGLLPRELARPFVALEQFGPVILILLIFLPFFLGLSFSPLHEFMSPLINDIARLLTGIDTDVVA